MSINIDAFTRTYFYFDEKVPYKVSKGEIEISPILVKDSEIFLSSVDILMIDKNSLPDVSIIQMSYLQFIYQYLFYTAEDTENKINLQKFINLMILCLGLHSPSFSWDRENKPIIIDNTLNIEINAKQFEDIKNIILYQNIINYDDEYVNPEIKKNMDEVDEIKNRNKIIPSLERKMAIISAHSGITKKEQKTMTYRSHCLLFEEVCGEVEFMTVRPISLIAGGKNQQMEHWIFKDKKNKFDGYVQSVDNYTQNFGGSKGIKSSSIISSDSLIQSYNDFK